MIETTLGKALVAIYEHKMWDHLCLSGPAPYSKDTPCLIVEEEEDAPEPYDRAWLVCIVSDISDEMSPELWEDEDLHVLTFETDCEPDGWLDKNIIKIKRA